MHVSKLKKQRSSKKLGEPGKYVAIDFSEGPNLQIGSFIGNLKITNINPPFITFEKVF